MDPTRLMTMDCTVTPRVVTGVDVYGNDVLEDGDPFDTHCFVWQGAHRLDSTENTGPENVTTDQYGAAFPPDDPVGANARVNVEGLDYEVDGMPWPAFNPRLKRVTHLEVNLKRVA